MFKNITLIAILLAILSVHSSAQVSDAYNEGIFDPPYKNLIQPIDNAKFNKSLKSKNDSHAMIELQTPVKSQGGRGTCSIFSATALLEGVLSLLGHGKLDLSEEWLEYLAMEGKSTDGSNTYINIPLLKKYGTVNEATWPYNGVDWTKSYHELKETRCGHLTGYSQTSCYLGHRDHALMTKSDAELQNIDNTFYDPEFLTIRDEAREFKNEFASKIITSNYTSVYSTAEVKNYLEKNIPLTLGIQVHYGAWNHRLAETYGIGRSAQAFNDGIVGYPEYGSVDREVSSQAGKQAGHSVVIVGYDDDRIVTTSMKMQDGTTKEFTYKGVYYFKNSWGTYPFGSNFEIDGVNYPGYGMITQKYAHEFGSFDMIRSNY